MENQDMRASRGAQPQLERLLSPAAPEDAGEDREPKSVDAWLERRLRVFERGLAQLEARQEMTERELTRRIALLEERLAAHEQSGHAMPEEPRGQAMPEPRSENTADAAEVHAAPPALPLPPQSHKQIGDVLARARRAANDASTIASSSPKKAKGAPRWMAWAAVGCTAAMGMTALALGNVAGASEPVGALSHNHEAQAFGRVIALADSGDPRDQTVVAFAYLRGQHYASDHQAAERWARAAAERGDPMAQYLLGALYQAGDGVAADPAQAFHWFEAAALGGNLKAMHDLAIAYEEGRGTGKNPGRAAAWFNRAAGQGYTDSQFDLAVLYERGDGVKQNAQGALKWYLIAAHAGDKEAAERAGELELAMADPDVQHAQMVAGMFVADAPDRVANNL